MKKTLVLIFLGFSILGCNEDSDNKTIVENPLQTLREFEIPPRFPIPKLPEDNPLTEEGISLGRMLFYDPILSADSTQACGSCHVQEFAFTDNGKRFSVGIDSIQGDRNAMAVINVAWIENLFWDGRAKGVEGQAFGPVVNPVEMHETWENVVEKLKKHSIYPDLFTKTFRQTEGEIVEIDSVLVVKAIAQFERTLISSNSKYDKFLRGELSLSDSEKRGNNLFFTEKADCFHCHGNALGTDNIFHNNGSDPAGIDPGLFKVTEDFNDYGMFRTPTLRNIQLTAPYMHNGSFNTLEEVVNHYNSGGGIFQSNKDPLIRPLGMTAQEREDLVAFLKTLTDSTFITNPDFGSPF